VRRYELKYLLDAHDAFALESILLSHPAGFRKLYPNRIINNIYFDTPEYNAGGENLAGISDRTKIRYRWYGEKSTSDDGILEFKIKENTLGYKKYIHNIKMPSLAHLVSSVNDELKNKGFYVPSLQNKYLRSYYSDFTQSFRLTIDRQISYQFPLEGVGNELPYKDDRIVVEIKFDQEKSKSVENISRYFPFRLSKHSKYAAGIMALYNS